MQRRFKKNPEAYVEYHHYESLKRISLLEIPNLDENVNIMASSLLRCLGLPADSARFEPMSK